MGEQGGHGAEKKAPTWFPAGINVQNQISHEVQIESAFILRLGWGKRGQSQPRGQGSCTGHGHRDSVRSRHVTHHLQPSPHPCQEGLIIPISSKETKAWEGGGESMEKRPGAVGRTGRVYPLTSWCRCRCGYWCLPSLARISSR